MLGEFTIQLFDSLSDNCPPRLSGRLLSAICTGLLYHLRSRKGVSPTPGKTVRAEIRTGAVFPSDITYGRLEYSVNSLPCKMIRSWA